MKNRLFIIIALLVFVIPIKAQNQEKFVLITIETKAKKGLHKTQIDYWVVSLNKYKDPNEKPFFPLYISGFSATDYNECCNNKNLILFNVTSQESFEYENQLLDVQKKLIDLIKIKRRKIQSIEKKWLFGNKITVNVYMTPITGDFCFCELSHNNDNSELTYVGQVAVPKSGYNYNSDFWSSELYKAIQKYDFGNLPFVSLHTMQ